MKGVYTAAYKIAGLNASKTMMYLTAPSNKVVEIIACTVTNESNATNQQMEVQIANISTLGTPHRHRCYTDSSRGRRPGGRQHCQGQRDRQ
jgi:hypothetical protein